MNRLAYVAALVLVLPLAACSSGDSPAVDEPASPTQDVGDGRECLAVDQGVLELIVDGVSGVAMTPVAGAAVKSESFEDAYIVAMSFDAAGGGTEVGAWATSSLADESMTILAVDGTAQSFTQWPGQVNGQKLDVTEDGVVEAKACLAG